MYHSITFYPENEPLDSVYAKNTWDDWHLIPSSRPVIVPPEQKTTIVDVPGSYGTIDASNSLAGYPVYGLREGSLSFYVMNDYEDWATLYSKIQNYLNGENFKMILEDDASYYYYGRITVSEWQSDPNFSGVSISYHVYPFKKERVSSDEDWLWDPFNFETDIIREYKDIAIPAGGTKVYIDIPLRSEYIVPTFIVSSESSSFQNCHLFIKDKQTGREVQYFLNKGQNEDPNIVLGAPGYKIDAGYSEHIGFNCSVACTVTIVYRGGAL